MEERDKNFPAFRNLDCANWSKWRLLPGALIYMVPSIFIAVSSMVVTAIFLNVVMIGYKKTDEPMKGWRKVVIDYAYIPTCTICTFAGGAKPKLFQSDCDYSKFLGKDYKKTQVLPLKTSTLVVNHSSWLDATILTKAFMPSYLTAFEYSKVPAFNTLIECLQGTYIKREGTEEQRADVLDQIIAR